MLRTGTPLSGRQVHELLSDECSLWTVQRALRSLVSLGLIHIERAGRADMHTINEQHHAVAALRSLLDPFEALTTVVADEVGNAADSVIVFGSVARGEAGADSDIDLAVIASEGWDGRADLEDAVQTRLGNGCDVLHLTPSQFRTTDEQVIADILRDGVPLVGSLPDRIGA
jgi:predicted nucleotidyltransferase